MQNSERVLLECLNVINTTAEDLVYHPKREKGTNRAEKILYFARCCLREIEDRERVDAGRNREVDLFDSARPHLKKAMESLKEISRSLVTAVFPLGGSALENALMDWGKRVWSAHDLISAGLACLHAPEDMGWMRHETFSEVSVELAAVAESILSALQSGQGHPGMPREWAQRILVANAKLQGMESEC